jgi:hypothetical protein
MSIIVCITSVAALSWAFISNPDLFSPAKFFLFSFLIFHLGALADHTSYELWMLILVVLLVGVTTVLFEALSPLPPRMRYPLELRRRPDPAGFPVWIWGLTLPAIGGEVFLLWKFGGLAAYINIISNRVIEFRGLGWALTLSATVLTFNLAYFAVGLTRTRGHLWWSLYGVHLLLSLIVGLLSGSRGAFLNTFAMQLFCYHYIRGRVRLTRALPIAVALLAFALVLGAVRNAVRVGDEGISTGLDRGSQSVSYGTFNYGVQPLEILLDADHLRPAYGMTFVSLVTNLVPRDWWPDKPDTGGVTFTKEYASNAWNGASNLTPTLLGEGVMNFGWAAGIAFYALLYPALLYGVVRYYSRVVLYARLEHGLAGAIEILIYVCVMWAVVGLMIAEVTSTVLGLLTTKLLPLLLLKAVFGLRLRPMRPLRVRAPQPFPAAAPLPGA